MKDKHSRWVQYKCIHPPPPGVSHVNTFYYTQVLNKLAKITHTAGKIINLPTPSLLDINDIGISCLAHTITNDADYPLNQFFTWLSSGYKRPPHTHQQNGQNHSRKDILSTLLLQCDTNMEMACAYIVFSTTVTLKALYIV